MLDDALTNDAGAAENPLFFASPGSARRRTATPSSARHANSTPVRGEVARRALGINTPRRTAQSSDNPTSPILHYPSSSSPAKGRANANTIPRSDAPQDSDPLHFPSYVNGVCFVLTQFTGYIL